MSTITDVKAIPELEQPEAATRAATECQRMAHMLRSLDPSDWSRPTDCDLWDVRAMAGHVVGMTETFTGLHRVMRDMAAGTRRAKKDRTPQIDGLTAIQVDRNAKLSTDQLIAKLEAIGPKNAKWRSGHPILRKAPLKQPMPDGTVETWKLAYLFDTILTRDTWLHRVDIHKATGKEMVLTADHDGRILADAVAEWARRHGQPFTLHLTGPVGATFASGDGAQDGEEITLDALDFVRAVTDRAPATGLLTTQVPF